MDSRWNNDDAAAFADQAEAEGHDRQLGLRIYSSRLIGQDPDLVLHGGGNTSVKVRSASGDTLMHIKGSGWDLDTIAAPGLPAVRLAPLLAAREGPALTDPAMVSLLRANLIDPNAPNPSVEALLHGFIDHSFVDHTHSSAVLALANQTNMAERVAALYQGRVAFVPYVMPGYDLSMEGGKIYDANPGCEGLWLENHGLFTFGPDARTSYERMIEFVTIAEAELARSRASLLPIEATDRPAPIPLLDAIAQHLNTLLGGNAEHVWDFRSTPAIRTYLDLDSLNALAHRGTATPDHVIRIKPFPLIVAPEAGSAEIASAIDAYIARYQAYFDRNVRRTEAKTMLDPLPRVVLIEGTGLAGIATTQKAASVAADLAEQTCRIVLSAERYGAFHPLKEGDLFDMEYWSLEQAKLKK